MISRPKLSSRFWAGEKPLPSSSTVMVEPPPQEADGDPPFGAALVAVLQGVGQKLVDH